MNISCINNVNFKSIYIDKSQESQIVGKSFYYIQNGHNYDLYLKKEKRCKNFEDTDVFVLKDGTVFVEKDNKKIYMDKTKPLFYQYYLALTYAEILHNGEEIQQ